MVVRVGTEFLLKPSQLTLQIGNRVFHCWRRGRFTGKIAIELLDQGHRGAQIASEGKNIVAVLAIAFDAMFLNNFRVMGQQTFHDGIESRLGPQAGGDFPAILRCIGADLFRDFLAVGGRRIDGDGEVDLAQKVVVPWCNERAAARATEDDDGASASHRFDGGHAGGENEIELGKDPLGVVDEGSGTVPDELQVDALPGAGRLDLPEDVAVFAHEPVVDEGA